MFLQWVEYVQLRLKMTAILFSHVVSTQIYYHTTPAKLFNIAFNSAAASRLSHTSRPHHPVCILTDLAAPLHQVLSGKLMPCRAEGGAAESARTFCRAFLEHGGLMEVVAVLRREPPPGDDQWLVQQQICLLTLQIARWEQRGGVA